MPATWPRERRSQRASTTLLGAGVPLAIVLGAVSVAGQAPTATDSVTIALSAPTSTVVATTGPLQPPGPPLESRHTRGGSRLVVVFGDSADHLRHNVIGVTAASVSTMGVLWLLPENLTYWRRDTPPLRRFAEAYTRRPRWDTDPWVINYIGHPLAGMHVYLLERNWGRSQLHSFLFATAASVGWEYGFEAFMERPSVQDLLITSPSGWLLGEAAYRLTQRLRRDGLTRAEKVVILVVNPLYAVQHGFR